MLQRAERVRHHGKTCDAEGHEPLHVGIVKRHLDLLGGILVVHVVDHVHGVHVQVRQPLVVGVKTLHDRVEVEAFALHDGHLGAQMDTAGGVVTAVDGEE